MCALRVMVSEYASSIHRNKITEDFSDVDGSKKRGTCLKYVAEYNNNNNNNKIRRGLNKLE